MDLTKHICSRPAGAGIIGNVEAESASVRGVDCFMERTPAQAVHMCPLHIALDFWEVLAYKVRVSPGHVAKSSLDGFNPSAGYGAETCLVQVFDNGFFVAQFENIIGLAAGACSRDHCWEGCGD